MPSNKKTAKSRKTPTSGGARSKAGKGGAKSTASSRATAPRARTTKSAAAVSAARAKASRAAKAKSAVTKSAPAKSVSSKSLSTTSAKSASVKGLTARSAAAKAAGGIAAKKTSRAKDASRAGTASARRGATVTVKTGSTKASVAKNATIKTSARSAAETVVAPKTKAKAVANAALSKAPTAVKPVTAQEANKSVRTGAPETSVTKKAEKQTAPAIASPATKALSAAAAAKRPPISEAMANKSSEKTLDKTVGAKVSAPEAAPVAQANEAAHKAVETRPGTPPQPAAAAAKSVPVAKPKISSHKLGFKLNEFIVYPAHGVGQITAIEVQEVAGFSLELFVVSFIKDKMILKVPTSKVTSVGMRKLAEADVVEKALATLTGRARIKRTMWSRRAQEYEAKINSGDLVTISEVVRDLYRSENQPEQSYSERQLYEAALDRMAREISAVRKLIDSEALKLIETYLLKGPRRGPKSESDSGDDDSDVVQAA
jgi:CarD family transcriptional regulator